MNSTGHQLRDLFAQRANLPFQHLAMLHYLRVHQQTDGGWGMHIESPSTMFGSCMCYIALRLLGAKAGEKAMVQGRAFIRAHGGGTYTGSWAKFYMCLRNYRARAARTHG